MVTKTPTKKSRATAGKPQPAQTAAPRRRKPAHESAAQALSSGRAAAKALKDTATQAGSAATAVAVDLRDLVAEASQNTLAINPLIGLSPRDVAGAAKSLLKVMSKTPGKTATHYGHYLKELATVVKGKSELAPDPKDRRFADPAWKSNALYTRLMQTYLATQKELTSVIETSKLDSVDKGRAQFFASLVTDALAPSNFVLGNPTAVRKIVDTGGGNLVKGLKHLVHDIRHNSMMPSQVDATPFKVGENVATSPGQVVHRDEMFELLQFAPTTPQVHKRPLVMSPPQVNKYYAVDLSPEKSLVKWTVDSGVQRTTSWRGTPTPRDCPASSTATCSTWSRRTRTSTRARSRSPACRSTSPRCSSARM